MSQSQAERPIAHADLFARLAAPFDPSEIRFRPQGNSQRQLVYVTARTVANRLDEVLGPAAWEDDYYPGQNSVICKLTVTLPDGTRVSKCDAGAYATTMQDEGDGEKGGFSDAFKRAAAKFLVGRYLYNDGIPLWVADVLGLPHHAWDIPDPQRGGGYNRPPSHPAPPPANGGPARPPLGPIGPRPGSDGASAPPPPSGGQRGNGGGFDAPKSGKGLFAWTKQKEQEHEVGLLKYLNNWGKQSGFPDRLVDWNPEQVALAYNEAVRKLQAVAPAGHVADQELDDEIPF